MIANVLSRSGTVDEVARQSASSADAKAQQAVEAVGELGTLAAQDEITVSQIGDPENLPTGSMSASEIEQSLDERLGGGWRNSVLLHGSSSGVTACGEGINVIEMTGPLALELSAVNRLCVIDLRRPNPSHALALPEDVRWTDAQTGPTANWVRLILSVYFDSADYWLTITHESTGADLAVMQAMFANRDGGLWVPRSSYLFQDEAATVPVAADGDPVEAWAPAAGNAGNLLMRVAGNSNIYRTSPSRYVETVTGHDMVATTPPETFVDSGTVIWGAVDGGSEWGEFGWTSVVEPLSTGTRLMLAARSTAFSFDAFNGDTGRLSAEPHNQSGNIVWAGQVTPTATSLRADGVEIASGGAPPGPTNGDAVAIALKSGGPGVAHAGFMVCTPALSAEELALAETYINSLFG